MKWGRVQKGKKSTKGMEELVGWKRVECMGKASAGEENTKGMGWKGRSGGRKAQRE